MSKMAFNPLISNPMREEYEAFQRRRVFTEPPKGYSLADYDLLTKFVVLFVDDQSPVSKERDFDVRKEQCYKLLKVKEINEVEAQGMVFRTLVAEYFKMAYQADYEHWYSLKIAFHSIAAQLREPFNPEKAEEEARTRVRTATDLEALKKQLNAIEAVLFSDQRLASLIAQAEAEDAAVGWAERFAE